MHRHLLHNGSIRESTDAFLSPGQVGFMNGWGVFSTLRIMDGVMFAFERHWARMMRDSIRLRVPMPPRDEFFSGLQKLIEANGARNATLRVAVVRNKGGAFEGPGIERPSDVIAFTVDLYEWGSSVRLALKRNARHGASEFAGAKITSWAQNLAWNEESHDRGFDEVLLLDEFGRVSELTSANVFVVLGNTVWTPPLDSGCLPGITREVLLEEVRLPGLAILEKHLLLDDLENASEVFITSSTRELLPVESIEGLRLRRESTVRERLHREFQLNMKQYVSTRTSAPV